jgi:Zn-dependent protease
MPGDGVRGLRFPLFGFPVRIGYSFLVGAAIIGFGSPNSSLRIAVLWTVIVLVSVLVHELGHAFAARGLGAQPTIDLYLFGGVTAFVPPRQLSRLESIWITVAGPLAGFALGGFVLSVAGAFGVSEPSLRLFANASLAEQAVSISIYVNLIWGLVNLLPILPLDGGNVVRSLLPGTAEQRNRIASVVSAVLAVGLIIWLVRNDYQGLVLLPGFLAAVNLYALVVDRQQPAAERTEAVLAQLRALDAGDLGALASLRDSLADLPTEARDRAKVTAVEVLVRRRRGDLARQALELLPGAAHPSAYALVEIVDGAPAHGIAMLDDLFARAPSPSLARYVLMARVLGGRAIDVPALYEMLPHGTRQPEVLRELQHLAHVDGDHAGAVAIGEHLLSTVGGADPLALYNVACSAARLGDQHRALVRLSQAVDAGWADAHQLDTDHDLASLWVTPEFRAIRQRVPQRSTVGA